jgi:hypothetical protein
MQDLRSIDKNLPNTLDTPYRIEAEVKRNEFYRTLRDTDLTMFQVLFAATQMNSLLLWSFIDAYQNYVTRYGGGLPVLNLNFGRGAPLRHRVIGTLNPGYDPENDPGMAFLRKEPSIDKWPIIELLLDREMEIPEATMIAVDLSALKKYRTEVVTQTYTRALQRFWGAFTELKNTDLRQVNWLDDSRLQQWRTALDFEPYNNEWKLVMYALTFPSGKNQRSKWISGDSLTDLIDPELSKAYRTQFANHYRFGDGRDVMEERKEVMKYLQQSASRQYKNDASVPEFYFNTFIRWSQALSGAEPPNQSTSLSVYLS